MELFEAINQRKTIRDFENEVISKEILEKIISAGLKTPTNDHMRDWLIRSLWVKYRQYRENR